MKDEFYNLTVKGDDLKTYIRRFQELAVLCLNMVPNTEKLMEAFIGGLTRSIEGNVTASKPQTLEEAINITQRLMDQVTRHNSVQGTNDHKRKFDDRRTFNNNYYQNNCNNNNDNPNNDHHQQQNRRQEIAARDRQRSYANVRQKPLEVPVGDRVMLKVVGPVAYKLELPEELKNVYNTFHVSNLKKCFSDESLVIPMKELQLNEKQNFVEEIVEVIDREIKQLR
ncbi:hypothetical protein Tco_1091135 [Tanacetum coccineum]|uniref:Tf2-1-like SH3-like domain-containing protein n=1 Tax=Tanacetum coccineum TaxID=301880 RepID=A0ABQ5I8J1_9ASTR